MERQPPEPATPQQGERQYAIDLIEVELEHVQPVTKTMAPWATALVRQRAFIDGAGPFGHNAIPRASQTRSALTTPSSWKPFRQYAPQYDAER